MFAIIVGIIFVGFTAFSVIPAFPLNWGPQVIEFLKGSLPVFAAFIGLICLFMCVTKTNFFFYTPFALNVSIINVSFNLFSY